MAKRKCSDMAKLLYEMLTEVAARPEVKTFDDAFVVMNNMIPELTRQGLADSVVEYVESNRRDVTEDQKILRAIMKEPLLEKAAKDKAEELFDHLENGTIPKTVKREDRSSYTLKLYKEMRSDMRKQVKKAEPSVKERLDKTIERLDRRIKEGDILPVPKVELTESKEIQQKRDDILRRQAHIRIMQQELKPRSLWARTGRRVWDTFRNFFSTGEFSYILRQGGFFAAAHPIKTMAFQGKHLGAVLSEEKFAEIMSELHTSEKAAEQRRNKLAVSSIEGEFDTTIIEEQIMGNVLESIPVLGKVFRAFDRGAVVYLSMVRSEWYNIITETGTINGNATKQEGKAIANFVNSGTGRANLAMAENSARILADFIYSPRYALSRLQMATGWHIWTSKGRARKAIAKEYARMMISVSAVLGLAEMLRRAVDDEDKFDIEWNLLSADSTKLRFGNRRVDFLFGLNQVVVLFARVISGKKKSSTTGKITPIRGKDVPWGGDLATDIIKDFASYKASPMVRNFANFINQRTFDGPLTWQKVLEDNTLPITIRDIFEAFQEEGINASVAVSMMSFFGAGLNTYGSDDERLIIDKYLEDFGIDFQIEELGTLKEIVGID